MDPVTLRLAKNYTDRDFLLSHRMFNCRVMGVSTGVNGTGAVLATTTAARNLIRTGTTNSSHAFINYGGSVGLDLATTDYTSKTFDVPIIVNAILDLGDATANGVASIYYGKNSGNIPSGTLAAKGFGVAIKNNVLYIQTHDGTNLNDVNTTVTFDTNRVHLISMAFTPANSLIVYRDGVLIDTITTYLPSGTGSTKSLVALEALNNADDAQQRLNIYDVWVYQKFNF